MTKLARSTLLLLLIGALALMANACADETIPIPIVDEDALPTPDPAYETRTFTGVIIETDTANGIVTIGADNNVTPEDQKTAVISDETILINDATDRQMSISDLRVGDPVRAYLALEETRSIPPQSNCFALIASTAGEISNIDYVRPLTISLKTDEKTGKPITSGVNILNQNADLWYWTLNDLSVAVYGSPDQKTSVKDIHAGSQLIIWHDQIEKATTNESDKEQDEAASIDQTNTKRIMLVLD